MFTRFAAFVVLALVFTCTSTNLFAQEGAGHWSVSSPDQSLTVTVMQNDDGALTYTVSHESVEVIHPSRLGIVREDQSFADGLVFDSAEPEVRILESYTMLIGKDRSLYNNGRELTLNFHNTNSARLQIILRAYDDGVAFRYRFPEEDATPHTVIQELTTFKVSTEGQMWIQPYDQTPMYLPVYERYYSNHATIGIRAGFVQGRGWAFPALFHTDNHWILLTEADLDGSYFGAHLGAEPEDGEYEIAMPLEGEAQGTGSVEPTSTLPWVTPWRVIMVGATPEPIVESSLVYHLSAPRRIEDTSWIHPGRVSWSWWSDHDSSRDYDSLTHFVDLAADMGWEYSLVDANWNIMNGGTLEQLVEYASERGVGLLVWYNSGGEHTVVTEQPRDLMADRDVRRAEFARLEALGVRGVKVDFFESDKPHIIQLYLDILQDAADYHLLVDFHGSTIPRGWSRTYPNLMTMEAVRGAEYYTFDNTYSNNAPVQNTILPFTRNVIGPMDYTPVTFTDEVVPHLTTNAHELALSVIFESGLTHLADSVEAYENLPDEVRDFLQDLRVVWDETQYLAGEPGDFIVLARRSGDDWYISGINGQEEAREITLDLSPFVAAPYTQLLIQDDGVRGFNSITSVVEENTLTTITMQPYGGFVMRLEQFEIPE
jgi:alpha-glucosidase